MGTVELSTLDECGVLTLSAPMARNAWTRAMQREVASSIQQLDADDSIRAIILTGEGQQAFCAGQDLAEVATFTVHDVDAWLAGFAHVYDCVLSTTKPVVAALNGVAAGSGYQLALLCDSRVAHEDALIGQPEVRSGIPSVTGLYLTWQSLGHSRTADLLLSGRMISGREAYAVGLVNHICDADQVMTVALEVANDMADCPPHAFSLTKQRIKAVLGPGLRDAFEAARELDRIAYGTGEPQATARRFLARHASASGVDG